MCATDAEMLDCMAAVPPRKSANRVSPQNRYPVFAAARQRKVRVGSFLGCQQVPNQSDRDTNHNTSAVGLPVAGGGHVQVQCDSRSLRCKPGVGDRVHPESRCRSDCRGCGYLPPQISTSTDGGMTVWPRSLSAPVRAPAEASAIRLCGLSFLLIFVML